MRKKYEIPDIAIFFKYFERIFMNVYFRYKFLND